MMKGNMIKSEIVLQGLTMKQVAERLGISANSLTSKVNGRSVFNTEEVIKLCEILHITDAARKVDIFLTESSQN